MGLDSKWWEAHRPEEQCKRLVMARRFVVAQEICDAPRNTSASARDTFCAAAPFYFNDQGISAVAQDV